MIYEGSHYKWTSESNDSLSPLISLFNFKHTSYTPQRHQQELKSNRAEDQFVGLQIIKAYVPSLENLWQIKLKPNSLSLFDLAVLADSVHDHDPLYSVLKHHCYWFAGIVCAVIEKVYPCTTIHSKKYAPVSEDTICIPANDSLPDLAGRMMGISVCKVEGAIVSVVASNFWTYKEAKRTEVYFMINCEGYSLNTIREQMHCMQEYPAVMHRHSFYKR